MAGDLKAAALALHRFGLGPRPGAIAAIAADPRGALLAELERPDAALLSGPDLMTAPQSARAAFDYQAEQRARQILQKRQAEAQRANNGPMEGAGSAKADAAPPKPDPAANVPRRIILNEAKARLDAACTAQTGFLERLVWFWSNHFCVSLDKVPAMAGPYEREAIRPHVLGRFADMLLAAEGHPAMLFYLDNATSIGPDSVAGINRDKGLNENLAREILELHTLGVRTGYSQDDVTRFAKVLTGWTFTPAENPEHGGEFMFNRRTHEPGDQAVLGKRYADNGIEQGRAVLADLARHPATATHVARKLAVHFVADEPPPSLIEKLTKTFRSTDGNLKEVSRALITAPEAWTAARRKLKRPDDWIVSALRAANITEANIERLVQAHTLLGQPLWRPPSPQGFSDEEAAWLDGMSTRLDIANVFATRLGDRLDARSLVDEVLGPLASHETRETINRAESRPQAFALLLLSPEFQRR